MIGSYHVWHIKQEYLETLVQVQIFIFVDECALWWNLYGPHVLALVRDRKINGSNTKLLYIWDCLLLATGFCQLLAKVCVHMVILYMT